MVTNLSKMVMKEKLKKLGLHFILVDLGEVEIMEDLSHERLEEVRLALLKSGLELMDDKRAILIEKIKTLLTELIYADEAESKLNYSDVISQKLNYDYTYLSNLFSEVKGITIQHFIIIHKIERVKELILYGEMNLTEISYKLDYSSVAHLSNQFKKVTGLSPSAFKHLKIRGRESIEDLGNSNM
jgi:AraC-like DNA-binding protein